MYINPNINHLYRVGNAHSRKGCLRLDMNENPEGLPRKFVDHVLAQITPEFLASYPEKQPAIQALASYYQIGENQLDLFNGSDEAIRLIFETFADPEKKILASDPTFAMYGVYAKMFGLEYETVSYDTSFQFPTDDFIRRIDDRTSLIFTLNPNNPIGTAFTMEEMEQIVKRAQDVGALVVIDEAYHYFYPNTFLELIPRYDNVIILRTFSKLFSLAACRLGVAISNPDIIAVLSKANCSYNVNSIALKFAEELMKRPDLIQDLITIQLEG
ncbi:MAG: pyridoxal phosphate-dependent aminotransferase, partial [Lachnospiraceae bacterium]